MSEREMSFEEWFEEMAALARKDPALFEERRKELISQAISQAAPENRKRLECLQWRIDRERERARTPLGACIRLYDMLMEMVYGEGGFLEAMKTLRDLLVKAQEGKGSVKVKVKSRQARVIPFPQKTH